MIHRQGHGTSAWNHGRNRQADDRGRVGDDDLLDETMGKSYDTLGEVIVVVERSAISSEISWNRTIGPAISCGNSDT